MKLKPNHFQAIVDVFIDAFNLNMLEALMRGKLNEDLDALVNTRSSFTEIITELLQWAERENRVQELLEKAGEENATNRRLAEMIGDFNASYFMSAEEESADAFPWLEIEPELVKVEAGPFWMGSDAADDVSLFEMPRHEVILPTYHIGRYPVTNAQYAHFIAASGHAAPQRVGWFGIEPPPDRLQHPVSGINWYDATAYCDWLSAQTENHRCYGLPSEAEWEKAARGQDGRIFPWGDVWDATRCNNGSDMTTPVTQYETGISPYGCFDMCGNIAEWTRTLWGTDWRNPTFAYPYSLEDGRETLTADALTYRIYRGGNYTADVAQLRCSARSWYMPDHHDKQRGFRVVVTLDSADGN